MAAGDLLLRLLLNTADFDKNLKKSKKEVSAFKEVGEKGFGAVAGVIGKFAGAAGVAVGSIELFNKAIESSQTLTDSWGRSVEVVKVGFDNLMYAVANADFSSFAHGLQDMADKARDAYDAYDQLANTIMSGNFSMSLDQMEYRKQMSIARNKSLPMEEREAALARAKALAQTMEQTSQKISEDSVKALKARFAAKSGADASFFTQEMIEEAFRVDAKTTSSEERAAIESKYNEYVKKMNAVEGLSGTKVVGYGPGGQVITEAYGDAAREKREKERLQAQYADVIVKYLALYRMEDKELQAAMQTYLSAVSAANAASEMRTSTNEVSTSLANETKTANAKAAAEAAKREQEALAARQQAAQAQQLSEMAGLGGEVTAAELPGSTKGGATFEDVEGDAAKTARLVGDKIFNQKQQEMEKYAEGINMISDAFSSLGGAVGGAAGSTMQWVASTAQAVQAILPLISYLWAEKIAHDANASAAMKEAAAKSLASYAGIPFAGIALGLSAVAAIVGVMASLPKFAEGGIVNSPTLGLFGEAGPEAVMPLDKLQQFVNIGQAREVRVVGQIKASGKDLAVIIDNYEKVRRVK